MRILIANETYPPDLNGAAIFTQRLAQNLAKKGHDVTVIAPSVTFADAVEKDEFGVTVYRIKSLALKAVHPDFRFIAKPSVTSTVGKIVDEFKPDIIHIQNHFTLGRSCLKAAKKNNIPIMGTNHFMPENLVQFVPGFIGDKIVSHMWKDCLKVYNQLDYLTAPSNAAVKMLKDIGYKKEARALSNGIEFHKFKKRSADKALLKKYGISPDLPTFISVGRIEKDKNIDLMLKALSIVLEKKKVQLVLVGQGKFYKKFKKMSHDLKLEKSAIFTGKVSEEDLMKIYSLADVYIGAGTAELQGIAVMEGMASGLPVLAVNAVALPELVTSDENGYLFELEVEDLADKMLRIIEDEKRLEKMAKKSSEIISKHEQGEIIKEFEEVYEKVISKKKQKALS